MSVGWVTIPNIMEAGHNVLRFNLRDRRSVDTGFWAWLQWGCGCALEHQKNDLNESKNNMCWNDFVKKNALSVWLCESILFNTFDPCLWKTTIWKTHDIFPLCFGPCTGPFWATSLACWSLESLMLSKGAYGLCWRVCVFWFGGFHR